MRVTTLGTGSLVRCCASMRVTTLGTGSLVRCLSVCLSVCLSCHPGRRGRSDAVGVVRPRRRGRPPLLPKAGRQASVRTYADEAGASTHGVRTPHSFIERYGWVIGEENYRISL
jgi:hypothetical protein